MKLQADPEIRLPSNLVKARNIVQLQLKTKSLNGHSIDNAFKQENAVCTAETFHHNIAESCEGAVVLASKLIEVNDPINLHLHGNLKTKLDKMAVNYLTPGKSTVKLEGFSKNYLNKIGRPDSTPKVC